MCLRLLIVMANRNSCQVASWDTSSKASIPGRKAGAQPLNYVQRGILWENLTPHSVLPVPCRVQP